MAEAARKTETVTVTKVVLTLTEDEARTLRAILGHIGGDERLSPRRHADEIAAALGKAGFNNPISTPEGRLVTRRADGTGIRFANYGNGGYMTREDIRRADGISRPSRAWGSI